MFGEYNLKTWDHQKIFLFDGGNVYQASSRHEGTKGC